jgi:hypothetical protein
MVADGFTRSSAADRNGIIISLQTSAIAEVANGRGVATPIHDSLCWDRRTLERAPRHRKKLGPAHPKFTER